MACANLRSSEVPASSLDRPTHGSATCVAAEEGLSVAAEDAGSTGAGDLARLTCGGASFTAGTKVLLASDKAVPISQLKPGDKVLATNTRTGKTQTETVSAVMVNHATDLYDLQVMTAHGTAVIDTTRNHPFWDPTARRWIKAAALKHGSHLRTAAGSTATVLSGQTPKVTTGWMWDLTVPGNNDHDFYIEAGFHSDSGSQLRRRSRRSARRRRTSYLGTRRSLPPRGTWVLPGWVTSLITPLSSRRSAGAVSRRRRSAARIT